MYIRYVLWFLRTVGFSLSSPGFQQNLFIHKTVPVILIVCHLKRVLQRFLISSVNKNENFKMFGCP